MSTSTPDVLVWVADGFAAEGLDYGDRLVDRLSGQGLCVARRDLTSINGAVPPARLHILSGGATSVNDRSTWMPRALALTRLLVQGAGREDYTIVGICLGSQMIAEALWPGGIRSCGQIEVGLTEVQWHDGESECIVVPAFHYEGIDPSMVSRGGGQVVAGNAHSLVQSFRIGFNIWGLQFHPEFNSADMRRLVKYHRPIIEAYGGTVEAALRSVEQFEVRWKQELFDRIFHRISTGNRVPSK
ncbi:MAG: type 1 glutamine amidotransferase [Candidatus Dormibacteraceae bacterium]